MSRTRWVILGLLATALSAIPVGRAVRTLRMTRGGVATYARLLGSANLGDLDAVRLCCSKRFLATHRIERSPEGGVVGFPRAIHRNFRAWVERDDVWLCPTDRIGPIYRFVLEDNIWKYDGLIGMLIAGGRVEPVTEGDPSL